MAGLNEKQEKFIQEIVFNGKSQRQAYIAAGYSSKQSDAAIDVKASMLFNTDKVQIRYNALKEQLMQAALEEGIVERKDVIRELARVGFANATDYVKINTVVDPKNKEKTYQVVSIKDTDDIPESKRSAISSIKQGKHGIEIKLYDKAKALQELKDILNLQEDIAATDKEEDDGFIEAMRGEANDVWQDD